PPRPPCAARHHRHRVRHRRGIRRDALGGRGGVLPEAVRDGRSPPLGRARDRGARRGAPSPAAELAMRSAAARKRLAVCWKRVPLRERLMLTLVFFEGLTFTA